MYCIPRTVFDSTCCRFRTEAGNIIRVVVLALLALSSVHCEAAADTVALAPDFEDIFSLGTDDGATRGWLFSVLENDILVTRLGVFDEEGDGLLDAHPVGIWNWVTHELLVSATVPSGVDAQIVDSFRYVNVPPTILQVDTQFVIGAFYDNPLGDTWFEGGEIDYSASPPEVFFHIDLQLIASEFGFPETIGGNGRRDLTGFFGPNFQFVPEPTSMAPVVVGCLLVGCRSRRRIYWKTK